LPLLPAFEGEIGTDTGTAIQAVIHWNYSSICRGGRSLLERLVLAGGLSASGSVNSADCCCFLLYIADLTHDREWLHKKSNHWSYISMAGTKFALFFIFLSSTGISATVASIGVKFCVMICRYQSWTGLLHFWGRNP